MKKICLSLATSFILVFAAYGISRDTADYVKSNIVLEGGKSIDGYVEYKEATPGILQKGIKYLTPDVFELLVKGEKVKGKQVSKLAPKEIEKINLSNGREFVSVKYADLTAAGPGSIPKKCIFEVVLEGKIMMYKKFPEVGGVTVISGEEATAIMEAAELTEEEKIAKAQSNYELLISKGEKMPKSLSNVRLPDFISDNQAVLDEFNNNTEYSDIKAVLSSKIKPPYFNTENHYKYAREMIKLITEYNK